MIFKILKLNLLLILAGVFFKSPLVAAATSPGLKNEGVNSEVSAATLQGLDDWLAVMKQDIDRALDRTDHSSYQDRERFLMQAVDQELSKTIKYSDEFLSRDVLYRAQEIYKVLQAVPKEPNGLPDPKRDSFVIRFLTESLRKALALAPDDVVMVREHKASELIAGPSRIHLGLSWALWMTEISPNLPTNESQVQVLQKIMGFLVNDIKLDNENNQYLTDMAHALLFKDLELERRPTNLHAAEKLPIITDARDFLISELSRTKKELRRLIKDPNNKFEFEVPLMVSPVIAVKKIESAKDESDPPKEYKTKAILGIAYEIDDGGTCINGYIKGQRTNGSPNHVTCLFRENLGSIYITDARETCISGYTRGASDTHGYFNTVKCLRIR